MYPTAIRRVILAFVLMQVLYATGCGPAATIKRAGRTLEQQAQIIDPGTFGDNAPADRRRIFFNFWNEEIIRQDVAVGTVFMGDSITETWELAAYFKPADGIIVNRGISGDIASHMVKRFEADVLQLRPRNVVILAGTNDVARMLAAADKTDDEIVASVTASLDTMMDAARAAKINTLVCSILPTNADTPDHAGKSRVLPRINEHLKAACKAKGCIWVDYATRASDATGQLRKDLARDGLHPHYAGFEVMAHTLAETALLNGLRL